MGTPQFDDEVVGQPVFDDEVPTALGRPVFDEEEPGLLEQMGQSLAAAPWSVAAGLTGVPRAGAAMLQPFEEALLGTEALGGLKESLAGSQRRLEAEAAARRPDTQGMHPLMRGITNAPESVGVSLAGVPLAVATKNPMAMLAPFGAVAGGQAFGEAQDEGKGLTQSLAYGLAQGGIEVATEMNPLAQLMKMTGRAGLLDAATSFLTKEVLGEQAATVTQGLNEWATLHPEKPFSEFLATLPEAMVETLGATIAGSGIQLGAMKGVATAADALAGKERRREEELVRLKEELTAGVMGDNRSGYAPTGDSTTPDVGYTQPPATDAATGGFPPNATPFQHPADTPDLTPAETRLAAAQLTQLETGILDMPENPEALQDIEGMNEALTQPGILGAEAAAADVEAKAQEILDRNPAIGRAVALRRAQDEFQTSLPPDQRVIRWSSDASVVGLSSRQAKKQAAGEVRLIGGHEEQFSPALVEALGSTLTQWSEKYLAPGERLLVNLSGLEGDKSGAYLQLPNGVHVISPRELVRTQLKEMDGKLVGYNPATQSEFLGALSHEFGHALVMSQFVRGMPEEFRFAVNALDSNRYYREQELQRMPVLQQAVVRDFQQRKSDVLSGKMTAAQLAETWLGTWKVGRDLMKVKKETQSLHTLAKKVLSLTNNEGGMLRKPNGGVLTWADGKPVIAKDFAWATARDLVWALGRDTSLTEAESNAKAEEYFLSFGEFMAEQFSRYAHTNKIEQGTALGQYFSQMLTMLREFFRRLKVEGIIKPGVAFQDWVDELVRGRALEVAMPEKPAKRKAVAKAVKPKARKVVIEEVVAGNVKHPTTLDDLANDPEAQRALRQRVTATFPPAAQRSASEKRLAKDALAAIAGGQELEFEEILAEYQRGKPKFAVKEPGGLFAASASSLLSVSFAESFPEDQQVEQKGWMTKLVKSYLQKYAGTARDPLKTLQVPGGLDGGLTTWEALMDKALSTTQQFTARGLEDAWAMFGEPGALIALSAYVRHAGDYLIQHVPEAKRGKYDFTRLIAETARWDREMRDKQARMPLEQTLAATQYKKYPDGFRWVQLDRPGQFAAESDMMAHSVRGYEKEARLGGKAEYNGGWASIESGRVKIYSLRNPEGQAVATVEAQRSELGEGYDVRQIKGYNNQLVPVVNAEHVRDFLEKAEEPWQAIRVDKAGLVYLRDPDQVPRMFVDEVRDQLTPHEYATPQELQAVLDPLLFAHKEEARHSLAQEKGFTVYRLDKLAEVLQSLDAVTTVEELTPDTRRLIVRALEYLFRDSLRLRYDNNSDGGKADIANANFATKALERIGFKDFLWASKAINFTSNLRHAVLQLQQLAATEQNAGLQMLVTFMNKQLALKNLMMKDAVDLAQRWEDLSGAELEKFEKVLSDEFWSEGHVTELVQENGVWRHKAGLGFYEYLKARGVEGQTEEGAAIAQMILDYKNSILEHIAIIENGAIAAIKARYHRAPLVVRQKSLEIQKVAREWRMRPFVPQGHFGRYVVKVFQNSPETGGRELVHREHFATAAELDRAVKAFQKRVAKENLEWGQQDEKVSVNLTMPREFLTILADTGEFSDTQLTTIAEAMIPLRAAKIFKTFMRDASKISGAEPDMLRNYVNWIEDNANATSKFIFGRQMTQAIAWTQSDQVEAMQAGNVREARRLQRLVDTMKRARGYIMHPLDEFHKIKNAVALTYLVWAPKTVLMNLTGLLQTWAAATGEYGDVAGNAAMGQVMKDLRANELTVEDAWALGRAEETGLLNQGFGYFMAGLSNAGNLARRIRKTAVGKGQRLVTEGGMKPFTAVEVVNRKVTLLTFLRLESARLRAAGRVDSQVREEAYLLAESKTRKLQNDFAAGNRPPVFQGKQSVLMIFYSYPQHMLWIMSGAYERGARQEIRARGDTPRSVMVGTTMRMWLIFLVLSGYSGIPFGETIIQLVNWLWKKFGGKENLELEAQRFLQETLGIESAYWRRAIRAGLLHNVGGVDLSGSYSLGTPLPGTRLLMYPPEGKRETVGALALELSGPFGGVVGGGVDLLTADKVGFAELAKALPGEAGSLARAAHMAATGGVDAKGARMLKDEEGRPRDATGMEIALTAAGFPLADITEKRFLERVQRDTAQYWTERRQGLQKDYARARLDKDRELVGETRKAINEYNREAPHGMALTGKNLETYVKGVQSRITKEERDISVKSQRALDQDVEQVLRGDNR